MVIVWLFTGILGLTLLRKNHFQTMVGSRCIPEQTFSPNYGNNSPSTNHAKSIGFFKAIMAT